MVSNVGLTDEYTLTPLDDLESLASFQHHWHAVPEGKQRWRFEEGMVLRYLIMAAFFENNPDGYSRRSDGMPTSAGLFHASLICAQQYQLPAESLRIAFKLCEHERWYRSDNAVVADVHYQGEKAIVTFRT